MKDLMLHFGRLSGVYLFFSTRFGNNAQSTMDKIFFFFPTTFLLGLNLLSYFINSEYWRRKLCMRKHDNIEE
jgi:hypothetical protein